MSHTFHRYKIGDEPVPGYRLTGHLGAGGFGEVWKADAPGGTEVALKIIDLTGQQGVQEFASLRVVKKVRHPNLISLQAFWMKDEAGQIIDEAGQAAGIEPTANKPGVDAKRQTQSVGVAATAFFVKPVELIIAMQLGSMSLHKRLEDCREQGLPGVPVAELLEYLEQAARGIDFLNKPIHDLGKGPVPIVHGDVKPHNILVVGDAAVVCDFGLARAVETLRKTSMAPVTVAYAAPESFKGKVTPTSDQYSLAITYVELRTGRLPFDETMTPYQVMEAHVLRALDFSRLPDPERQVVLRATENTPEDRWPSSRDLVLALRQAVAQTGELPLRPGEAAYSGGPTPRHSLTQQPRVGETGMPTRVPVDKHKETMQPGGHTPSKAFSLQTAAVPPGEKRHSDPLAETSMLGVEPLLVPPARKSKMPAFLALGAAVIAVLGIAVGPKIFGSKSNSAGGDGHSGIGSSGNSGGSTPGDDDPAPTDAIGQYMKAVRDKINAAEYPAAVELLANSPSKLRPDQKETLQRRLQQAFLSSLDTQVEKRSYGLALVQLEEAPSGIGLTDDDKQQAKEKIRTAWLAQAQEQLHNDDFKTALETATNLLKRFPGDRNALFIIARAQIRLSDYPAATKTLTTIGPTADLPAEYQPLDAGLLLLAKGLASSGQAEPVKLLDGFLQLAALEKAGAPPAALALNAWERGRLDGVRKTVVDNVEMMLNTLPADQSKALSIKLEQLGTSVSLEMFKVKQQLSDKKFDEARKTLATLDAKVPADDSAMKTEVAATGLLIDLDDTATKPTDLAKALDEAIQHVDKITPALRGELGAVAETLALGAQPTMLESATALVKKTHDLDSGDKPTSLRLARLLAARLAVKAAQAKAPTKDEVVQLIADCEQVEEAKLDNGTTDALHAECLLMQDSRDRQLITSLVDKAKPVDGYTQYVQARVLRNMPQPDWAKISSLLVAAYSGDLAKLPPLLAPGYRRDEAAKLLTDAALQKRAAVPANNPAIALGNPFTDAKAAAEAFQLLQLAAALASNADSTPTQQTPQTQQRQRELTANLALAAVWKSEPDEKLAHSLAGTLAKFSDVELGPNALPVLSVIFHADQAQTADQPAALAAAKRFVELFQKQFPVSDPQAVEAFKAVLKPALAIADSQAAAKTPPPELDKFYATAAEFIGHYQRANWKTVGIDDKQAEIEKLLTQAIKLNSKVAKYYTTRGVARISLVPPNVDGALADAIEAGKLDPNFPDAFALQGHALIYRSRQQPTAALRMADLDSALAKCQTAVEKGKPTDEKHAMHLLYLSMALLEKANLLTDPKLKRDLLGQAIANAQAAVDLEKAYPDYANTALGNALEDLAWLLNEEPEKNYKAAIDAFTRANEANPSAPDPLVGRARCFYKSVADSKLDPKFLDRTADQVMQAAIDDLQAAKQLKASLVEPNLWLAKAQQQQALLLPANSEEQIKKFAEADASFGEAVKLAEAQKLPERSSYLFEWARNAELNTALKPGEEKTKLVKERADKLKAVPSLGGFSTAKQAALLVGESLLTEKKFADAIKEYDAALADVDKADPKKPLDPAKADGSDVSLLLARAASRINLPASDWNLTASESAIKDVARVVELKPGPNLEAAALWYEFNAKSKSYRSNSPTITKEKKDAYRTTAVDDIRKAIDLAPSDPNSWQWRQLGAKMLAVNVLLADSTTKPETLKKWAADARKWIDDAIDQAAKRPDLAGQMAGLQRDQQELETTLTTKGLPRI
ncbi:MAG TPA: protein kinase [Pirellulales bacterium]